MRYFFEISYDGSAYNGWQRQSNTSNTIQEIIEKKISLISGSQTTIVGCGRTDKAVHARSFYFHVDFKDFNPETYTYKLNRMLPEDICIKGIYRYLILLMQGLALCPGAMNIISIGLRMFFSTKKVLSSGHCRILKNWNLHCKLFQNNRISDFSARRQTGIIIPCVRFYRHQNSSTSRGTAL